MSQAFPIGEPLPPRPRLRWLVAVPDLDPPARIESRADRDVVEQEPLPLLFRLPSGLTAVPEAPCLPPPPEPEPPGRVAIGEDAFFQPQSSRTSELPDAITWTGRLVQAIIEVLSGERPAQQLNRWLTPHVHAQVLAHSVATNQVGAQVRRTRTRRRVGSIRICSPADGVIEACVVLIGTRRARAMALRLEGLDGRWRCTALEVG